MTNQPLAEPEASVVIVGKPTETNCALVEAFAGLGHAAHLASTDALPAVTPGDVVLGRVDVLPTLDGVEPGIRQLSALERRGARLLNRPGALFAAHDKLSTALLLGRAQVAQPRTVHVQDASIPPFPPPYVLKPRFGSWGQEVHVSRDEDELRALLERVAGQPWFDRQGALVQEVVEPTGRDVRVVVAAGRVVGAIERRALPGEWRTNVSLGAVRRSTRPSLAARALALRAVAALGLDLAGVDIAGEEGAGLRVLEVNGAVDFTPEYGADVYRAAASALLRRAATRRPAPVGARTATEPVEAVDTDCAGALGVAAP